MTVLFGMAPVRFPRVVALALFGSIGVWACGSAEKGAPPAPSGAAGVAGSSAGMTSAGMTSGGAQAGVSLAGSGNGGLLPQGGAGGATEPGDAGASSGGTAAGEGGAGGQADGAGGACSQPCMKMGAGAFCVDDEVTWVCGPGDLALWHANCRDSGTSAVRYCCPPEFTGECP